MEGKAAVKKTRKTCGALALAFCLLLGCGVWPAAAEDAAPETIPLSLGYPYSPEEIMYLSGVKVTAGTDDGFYALTDTDGDGISELFVKAGEAGDVSVYAYDKESGAARLTGSPDDAVDLSALSWAGGGQWADGSIVGVAMQTGDPGPQNDFYLSANYGWLSSEHVSAAGEVSSGTDDLESVVSRNRAAMFDDTETYKGEDIQRLRDYYALAVNWERSETDGAEPAKKYLEAIEGVSSLDELTALLTDPEKDPFCLLLSFTVTLDVADTSHWAVSLSEDEFSVLPRVFHNYDAEDVASSRAEYGSKARHVLQRTGYTEADVDHLLADCFALEDELLAVAWPDSDGFEPGAFLPFDEVADSCENFPLRALLNAYDITEGSIQVYYPKYLEKLDGLYAEENLSGLKSYLLVHTAANASHYLDIAARTCLSAAGDAETDPEAVKAELERGCRAELLSPRGPLGVAEENAYMTYFADEAARQDLTALAEEIRQAFREMLKNEEWLSEEGKAAAIEKLDSMTFCVMRPDKLIDSSYLAVDPDGAFLDEYAKILVNQRKHNGAFTGKERVKGDWRYDLRPEIAASYTNAYYYGSFNQFFILAGFVEDSIYRPDMQKEEKLGKLGEIVGHELTHGFDPLGIQYDKDGNMVVTDENPTGWMPQEDFDAFQARAKKLAAYFDGIRPFPNAACDGSLVCGEAAADIGGMAIGLKIAEKSKNFDYDLYFRSHADLWRTQTTLSREQSTVYNEHPLMYLRINATSQQFDEFLETYGVTEGDGMYLAPEDRVAIW